MKRNRQILLAALLWAAAGSFVACSQDDEVTLNRPSGAVEQTVSEASSVTRGGDPVVCVIKTDTLGQVQGKVEAFVKEGGTSVLENITNLYIEGPINQTDINYIKNLQYLDSLSLEKALIHDGDGKQTDLLAANSFEGMKSESAVYLPETVTRLGACCFMQSNIRAIYMEQIVTLDITKRDIAFDPFRKIWYDEIERDQYGGWHFFGCSKLRTVKLSKQLVNLSPWMFAFCTSLQKLDLANVKEINQGAFLESGLEELTMTDYLVTIGIQAFRSCAKLKKVNPSNSVKRIDSYAFRGCTALAEFSFPDIQELGAYVLANCTNLMKAEWPAKITTIPNGTFECCEKLEFEIPNSITLIGNYAFNTCKAIASFTIPDGVTSLGEGVFQATNITSLPKGLKSIPVFAFRYCGGLTDITIPEEVSYVGEGAFRQCSNLSSLKVSNGNCGIGTSAFYGCPSLTNVDITACGNIADYAFYESGVMNLVINQCGSIGQEVFRRCVQLKSVSIQKCNDIGFRSFFDSDNIRTISIGICNNIGNQVFMGIDKLENVSIQQCNSIGNDAFFGCAMLMNLQLPESINGIGEYAFKGCTSLKELVIGSCQYVGERSFQYCSKLEKLKMGSITTIGKWAFEGCTALENLEIQSVEALQESAFMTCTKLKSIVLPEGLKSIDFNVFGGCSSLTNLTIPSTVNAVTDRGFLGGCTQLQYVRWNSTNADVAWLAAPNPNLLLYIPAGVAVDSRNSNVIVNGKANQIKLQQSASPFYCPEAFTATEIIFECDYGSDIWKNVATGNGVAARWNAIALPFTVKNIVSDNKGALAPFGSDAVNNSKAKPFWLCEMTADGFKDAQTIEANKPYLVAMPNNPNYLDEYNIQDVVSFKAQNVTIEKTPDELTPSPVGPDGWALTPVYMATGTTTNEFNINWEAFTDRKGEWHPVGNCFRLNIRPTYSFEAAILPNASTRAEYISLGGKATTRSTRPLGKVPQREDMPL